MHQIITKFRRFFIILTAVCLTLGSAFTVKAEVDPYADYPTESDSWENWPIGPDLWGRAACLMDMDTGAVLFAKGGQEAMYPASITKVMTAIIVMDNCDPNGIVTMTETGLADAYAESSNIQPVLGEQFTVDQCLQMLLVKSANDIASQLAEYTAGSVAAFADMLNYEAEMLGCVNTHFTNASGLEDDNHYTCAYDMCLIMREALRYKKFCEIIAMPDIVIPATEYSDTRIYEGHVYLRQEGDYYYDGCLGGKTGYTDISQSTLVCAAERNGRTLIGTVMGAPDTGTNAWDMIALFDYGFTYFNDVDLTRGYQMFAPLTEAPQPEPQTGAPVEGAPAEAQESYTGPAADEQMQTVTPAASGTSVKPTAAPTVTTSDADLNTDRSTVRAVSAKKTAVIIAAAAAAAAAAVLVLMQRRARNIRERKRRENRRYRNGGGAE